MDEVADNVRTQSIPQNPKDGAQSPANDKKRKAENQTPLKGNFGATNKVSSPTTKKEGTHCLSTGLSMVDLDMNEPSSQVFGLLLNNLNEIEERPPESDVEQLASEVLIDLASKKKNNSADLASETIDGRRKSRRFTLHPTCRRPLNPNSSTKSQAEYVRLKSAFIVDFVESILRADSVHDRFMTRRVHDNVAQKFDGAVRKIHYEFKTFDMKNRKSSVMVLAPQLVVWSK